LCFQNFLEFLISRGEKMSFRKKVAKVFYECVQNERSEIFGNEDPLPLNKKHDAMVMFPGLVTQEYVPGKGVLIMAFNPAGGGDNDSPIPSDHALYKAMYEFKAAKAAEVYEKFEKLNNAAFVSEKSWNGLSKHIYAILQATDATNNHAYINAIPYRIRGDKSKNLLREYFLNSFEKVVSKQLEILRPAVTVVLGKGVNNKAGGYYRKMAVKYYVVPGTSGWTYIKEEARQMIDKMASDIGNPPVFGKSSSTILSPKKATYEKGSVSSRSVLSKRSSTSTRTSTGPEKRRIIDGSERIAILEKYNGKTVNTAGEFSVTLQSVKKAEARGKIFYTSNMLGYLDTINFRATGRIEGFKSDQTDRSGTKLIVNLSDKQYQELLGSKAKKNW